MQAPKEETPEEEDLGVNKKLNSLENLVRLYIDELKDNLLPSNSKYKYLILIINVLHLLVSFCLVLFSLVIPPKLQIYIVYIYISLIVTWYLFDNCLITHLTNWLGDTNINLFPFKIQTMYMFAFGGMSISLLFYLYPKISIFNLLVMLDRDH
jgi:hypothetical protein